MASFGRWSRLPGWCGRSCRDEHSGSAFVKFGIQLNPYYADTTGSPWDAVERAARALDATNFDSLWLYDHFLYEGGYPAHPVPEPVMECFTTLGAVAALTQR